MCHKYSLYYVSEMFQQHALYDSFSTDFYDSFKTASYNGFIIGILQPYSR